MKILRALVPIGLLAAGLGLVSLLPAHAAPPSQVIPTNTASGNGNRYYIVKAGDSCFLIASLYGISDGELRQLNPSINPDCTNLQEGQELLVGTGGPAGVPSNTPGPPPTPGLPTPTPTPLSGTTEICVLLFDDLNGDALRQTEEPVILGGAISVTETGGEYSDTRETAINPDPEAYAGICFSDVPEGQYNIGAAIPDNYNPTMSLTYTLDINAGDRAFVDFGAQSRETPAAQSANPEQGGGTSPVLGIVGGLMLLGGVGLAWYALRLRNPRSRLGSGGLLRR